MRRTNIYLTKRQHSALGKEAERLNISAAELIRRVIDEWLDNREKQKHKFNR
jgi:hypothetical protein